MKPGGYDKVHPQRLPQYLPYAITLIPNYSALHTVTPHLFLFFLSQNPSSAPLFLNESRKFLPSPSSMRMVACRARISVKILARLHLFDAGVCYLLVFGDLYVEQSVSVFLSAWKVKGKGEEVGIGVRIEVGLGNQNTYTNFIMSKLVDPLIDRTADGFACALYSPIPPISIS